MVRTESRRSIGPPPTSVTFVPPLAFAPWHPTHLCAKIAAPCAAVPLPGGKPSPLGETLMSQAAISSAVIGLPRSGPAAKAPVAASAAAASAAPSSRVDMFHLAVALDSPARRAVVVLADECRDGLGALALATLGDDLRARRLRVSRLVPRAALQDRGAAVPAPRNAEAR